MIPRRRLLALSLVLVSSSCRGGCGAQPPRRKNEALALLPAETQFVLAMNFARIKQSPLWTTLSALARDRPKDRAIIEELTARTGLDPFRQVHKMLAAFPEEARKKGEFALILDGDGFDEKRLVTYGRDQARLRGADIQQKSRSGHTLWVSAGQDQTGGFFVGSSRFVLGSGGWLNVLADVEAGAPAVPSAASNLELVSLCERVDTMLPIWFAAIVPAETRRALVADPRYGAAASVSRLAGAVDLHDGLTADLVAELSNEADARALTEKIVSFTREAKSNPQMLMLGFGPYVDGLTATAEGPNVRVRLVLGPPQLADLLSRLSGLAQLRKP